MSNKPKQPQRSTHAMQDLGSLESIAYNDAAGAKKVIIIDAPIKRAVAGGEIVGAGKYVKVNGTSYTLDLLGRAHDPSKKYGKGDIVSQGADVYLAQEDINPEAFDSNKWRKVAPKQIAGIPCVSGAVVTTGRWHNTVTTAGWLVDDETQIDFKSVRD